jgi:prophage antirepressor-like protein
MSTIIPFQFETHALRVQVDDANQPWFNANDVCEALQLGNARQALESHVDVDDVAKRDVIDNLGRTQRANHVNESGLYALILGSTKDAAKRFKRWVTSEVLPSIRVFAPDTGPTAIRDERGQIVAVTRLIRA